MPVGSWGSGASRPGSARADAPPPPEIDNKALYELLNVPTSATTSEIKKAFRKSAMVHHPDKGGDRGKFNALREAFEILSDEDKRARYDKRGREGVDKSGQSGGEGADLDEDENDDLYSSFFGRRGVREQASTTPDITHTLRVTLCKLYTGCEKKLAINRNVLCTECTGSDGVPTGMRTHRAPPACGACKGKGWREQPTKVACDTCKGRGVKSAPGDECPKCKGSCCVKRREIVPVRTRILGRRTAPFPPFRIPCRVSHGLTPRS